MSSKKDRGSRNWAFTLNNYTPADVELYQQLECRYLCFGYEVAPETGTPHLQGFVAFADSKSFARVAALLPRAHIAACRGDELHNEQYCKKGGDFWEKGVRPLSAREKGAKETDRWQAAFDAVAANRIEDVPADIRCRNLKSIEYAVQRVAASKRKLETLDGDLEHEWHVGPPRVGKSRYAREEHPGAYVKDPSTAWWNDYACEDVVIIDDVDTAQARQAGDFKRWLDRYPFQAQTKGGQTLIRPRKIVITSNYHPKEIFGDAVTVAAILSRVTLVEWPLDETEEPIPGWAAHDGSPDWGL